MVIIVLFFFLFSQITFEERKGAEIDYLKRYGKDWKNVGGSSDPAKNKPSLLFVEQHPRFQIMCDSEWTSLLIKQL